MKSLAGAYSPGPPKRLLGETCELPRFDCLVPWAVRTETRCPPRFVSLRRIRDRGTQMGKGVRRLPPVLAKGVGAVNDNNVAPDLTRQGYVINFNSRG